MPTENITEEYNSQYTFWKLLTEYRIEIPIIQRDYAQGRNSAGAIRRELLESLYDALTEENRLDFDFIYGTSEDCEEKQGSKKVKYRKLLPLDGQQRLTTLFLLHWYLAEKENRMDIAGDVLRNFSYTTRISSREFCEMIVDVDYTPSPEQTVSEYIKNENRYFKSWDSDPTIKAMLTMLDDIHRKFFSCKPLFDKLISESPAMITFNYLPMEHYALTDDLYIKMNARGKALSIFENFKAKFIQHLKKAGLSYDHFEANIDSRWVNLLWDYRSADNTVDKQFMNLFTYCTEMIFLYSEKPKETESPFRSSDIRKLVDYYDTTEKLELLYHLMDLWESKEEAKQCLENLLDKGRVEGKVRLFDGQPDIFSDVVLGNSVTIVNKILLFAVMLRMILLGKNADHEKMLDYVRIVRNFLIKNRSFNKAKCSFTPDFRFGRNGIPYTAYISGSLAAAEDPYRLLVEHSTEVCEGINSEIYRQESRKATIIISMPETKHRIQSLEDLEIFRGSIENVLAYAVDSGDDSLADNLERLFVPEYSDDIISAMLSIGNYGIRIGWSFLGGRYFFGNKNHWYEIMSYQGEVDYKNIIKMFVSQYMSANTGSITHALNAIRTKNLASISITDWRYCMVKYPSTIKNTEEITNRDLVFAFESRGGQVTLHRMNGKTLNAYHFIPEYIEVERQLRGKCYSIAGINSDERGKLCLSGLKTSVGPIYVEMTEDIGFRTLYVLDQDHAMAQKALDRFHELDKSGLDRVEQLVLLVNTAYDVLTQSSVPEKKDMHG